MFAFDSATFDPESPVKWDHPLTAGLCNLWLGGPNSGWWGGRFINLVANSKYAVHGTRTNGALWLNSYQQFRSVNFVGASSQYVSIAGGGGLNNLQTGSIISQCRWSGTQDAGFGGASGALCGRQKNSAFTNQLVTLNGTNPATAVARWHAYGTGVSAGGATAVGNGTWRTVGVSYTSGNHKLYLDGVQDGTGVGTGTIRNDSAIELTVGGWIGGGAAYMNGDVVLFAVFNRFLPAATQRLWHEEIKQGLPNVLNWIKRPIIYNVVAEPPPVVTGGAASMRRRKKRKPDQPDNLPAVKTEPAFPSDDNEPPTIDLPVIAQPDICPTCGTDLHLYNRLRREVGLLKESRQKLRRRVERLARRVDSLKAVPPVIIKQPVEPPKRNIVQDDDEVIRLTLGVDPDGGL